MASCNTCKQEYWLDFKHGGAKLELDRKTPHRCIAASVTVSELPMTEREKRIEHHCCQKNCGLERHCWKHKA